MTKELFENIVKWLATKEPDYHTGLSLFARCRNMGSLYRSLSRGPSSYNTPKLKYELEKIYNEFKKTYRNSKPKSKSVKRERKEHEHGPELTQSGKPSQQIPQSDKANVHSSTNNDGDKHSVVHSRFLSDIVDQVTQQRNALYAQRASAHGALKEAAKSDAPRNRLFDLAHQIASLQPKIDAFNDELQEIERTGSIPKSVRVKTMSAEQLKAQQNYRNYISRYKSKAKKAETQAERDKYNAYVEEYTKKLNDV